MSDTSEPADTVTGPTAAAELLRLVTCGSVDDGKSTLIGRLLFDTKQVFVDQMEHIEETSERRGDGYVNLALLTDGLRAEREQGITIDVAYRGFVTPRRRFQLADAPGTRAVHAQHGHGRLDGGRRRRSRRRPEGRDRADTPAYADRLAARGPPPRVRGQQDGSRRLRRGAVRRDRAGARRSTAALGVKDEVAIPIAALHGDNVVEARSGCRGGRGRRCSSIWSRSSSRATATSPTAASRCNG